MIGEDLDEGEVHGASDLADLFKERCIELTATAETILVGRQARVVEEITLRRQVRERLETVDYTLRHTRAEVETIAGEPRGRD